VYSLAVLSPEVAQCLSRGSRARPSGCRSGHTPAVDVISVRRFTATHHPHRWCHSRGCFRYRRCWNFSWCFDSRDRCNHPRPSPRIHIERYVYASFVAHRRPLKPLKSCCDLPTHKVSDRGGSNCLLRFDQMVCPPRCTCPAHRAILLHFSATPSITANSGIDCVASLVPAHHMTSNFGGKSWLNRPHR